MISEGQLLDTLRRIEEESPGSLRMNPALLLHRILELNPMELAGHDLDVDSIARAIQFCESLESEA